MDDHVSSWCGHAVTSPPRNHTTEAQVHRRASRPPTSGSSLPALLPLPPLACASRACCRISGSRNAAPDAAAAPGGVLVTAAA